MSGQIGAVVVDHDTGRCSGLHPIPARRRGPAGRRGGERDGRRRPQRVERLPTEAAARPGSLGGPGGTSATAPGNRGLAALAGDPTPPEWVLVCNPDLRGAPRRPDRVAPRARGGAGLGTGRPPHLHRSRRGLPLGAPVPIVTDAAGHALLALFQPQNPFTLRYNPGMPAGDDLSDAGWVSGSCFLARRQALEELGGFDEAYFMYLEDMDLCWRAHQAGWGVGFAGTADVTHVQGVSRPPSVPNDGGPPPLGLPLHIAHHLGLAPGRSPPGGVGAGCAHEHGHRPLPPSPPRARCAGTRLSHRRPRWLAATVLALAVAAVVGARPSACHCTLSRTSFRPPAGDPGLDGATPPSPAGGSRCHSRSGSRSDRWPKWPTFASAARDPIPSWWTRGPASPSSTPGWPTDSTWRRAVPPPSSPASGASGRQPRVSPVLVARRGRVSASSQAATCPTSG